MPKTDRKESLPYRVGVGIMLINRDGLVWLGRRQPKWMPGNESIWQMPQGGLAPKESPKEAALRELAEETGVRSVDILARAPNWLTYDLPVELRGVALKGRYRGQRQRWFAMRFTGEDSEIRIAPDAGKPEFDDWRWAYAEEAIELAVPYKRAHYSEVLRMFAEHVAPMPKPQPARQSWGDRLWRRLRLGGSALRGA